jgi:hypothetical protein
MGGSFFISYQKTGWSVLTSVITKTSIENQSQRWIVRVWNGLQNPKMTILTLMAIGVVLSLGLFLPQQNSTSDATLWISNLPSFLQPWGEFLFFMRLSHVFHTLWFWLPVAVLLLNSLVTLADYGSLAWQRFHDKRTPPVEWLHRLANRVERVVKLPHDMETESSNIKQSLMSGGFSVYESVDSQVVGAAKRSWAWLGIVAVYIGLVLLVIAFLGSYYALKTDSFVLLPSESKFIQLLAGRLELLSVDERGTTGEVVFTSDVTRNISWSSYQPKVLNSVLVIVTDFVPILTVEASDQSDQPVTLMPVQDDLNPSEQLSFSLDEESQLLYFQIAELTFQVTLEQTNHYNVQVLRENETEPFINSTVKNGEQFQVNQFSIRISQSYRASLVAYRDPFILFYILGVGLVGIGVLVMIFWPPLQLWFISDETWLYGVAEMFGPTEQAEQLLDEYLLAGTIRSEDEAEF